MLHCTETVTFVRYNGEGYDCATLEHCSWYDKTEVVIQDKGLTHANSLILRIPVSSVSDGWSPETGDYVVRGSINTKISRPADLQSYRPRKVTAVSDNRRGRIPHWKVVGA